MKKLLAFALASILTLSLLPEKVQAAFSNFSLIAPGSSAGQFTIWSITANNGFGGWVSTNSIVSNGTEVAIGGSVDPNSRLSVNPSGTSENGITVNMPSGFTGSAITVKNSTGGNLFYFDQYGYVHAGNFYGNFNGNCGNGTGSFNTVTSNVTALTIRNYVASPSANLTEWYLGSSNIPTATITTSCNANFPGYCQAVRTVTANDTATLADSLLLINGAYAETLPTTTNPTGRVYTVKNISASMASVTNTIDGTAGYTLMQNMYVTVIWSGSAFYKIGGN